VADLSCDIVILGAGVLGLAVATELAARGTDVRVIDPGDPNASAIAAGMIAPAFESLLDGADAARAALLRDAAALWPDVASPHDLILDRTPAQWRGPGPERIADRLRALGFRADLSGEGVSAPDDIRIDPTEALVRLRDRLDDRQSPASATALEQAEDGWLVHTTAGRARCRTLVLATGATAPLPGLSTSAALAASVVRPVAGQIGFVARPLTDRVLRGPDGYVVPAGQGTLIGATMVEGQSPAVVDPAASARLIAMAETLLGHALDGPVTWRAAIRGATPDGLPLAGPVGEGVHLALAPRRNGWLMAPLVARIVADGIEGRPRGAHAAALDPLRFTRPEA
jgi:glycine oxidase